MARLKTQGACSFERKPMFNLLKAKNPQKEAAQRLYASALAQTRQPFFYIHCAVPDSFDGRFDLLLLHVFLIMDRFWDEQDVNLDINQALFDETFRDMDQTLREIGVGDMGIPKHMRRMMKAFNGRMNAYRDALEAGHLKEALIKNIYGTLQAPDENSVVALIEYFSASQAALRAQMTNNLREGGVQSWGRTQFSEPEKRHG